MNLTGSPDYGARIVYIGDPGKGCSSDQYAQFNAAAVTGPTFSSVGLESGRNVMRGCPDKTVDLSLSRNIGGRRPPAAVPHGRVQRVQHGGINGRQNQIQFNSPTDLTIRNPQFLADGQVDPTRLQPSNAGFGAANGAQAMRTVNVYARFSF